MTVLEDSDNLTRYIAAYSSHGLIEINGKLFFAVDNASTGYSEVWTSDGTATGTLPIATNLIIDSPVEFVGYDGGIGFRAATPEVGIELFRIDTTIPVTAPTGLTVSNAAAGIQIAWQNVAGPTHYELWVNYRDTPMKPKIVYQQNVLQTASALASSLPEGRYQAWVCAVRAESGEIYTGLWSVALNFDIG